MTISLKSFDFWQCSFKMSPKLERSAFLRTAKLTRLLSVQVTNRGLFFSRNENIFNPFKDTRRRSFLRSSQFNLCEKSEAQYHKKSAFDKQITCNFTLE